MVATVLRRNRSRTHPTIGNGCLALFGLPFLTVGLFMGGWVAREVGQAWASRSWVEVPARIIEARLDVSTDSDGSTYQAQADYEYEYAGRTYRSSRVTWDDSHDNIGRWQQRTFERLEVARRGETDGTSLNAFVNPRRPGEAVLFRTLRPGLLALKCVFGLVFGGAGAAMTGGALRGIVRRRRVVAARQSNPAEVWRALGCWHDNRIRGRGSSAVWMLVGFALFWNLVAWPLAAAFLFGNATPSGFGVQWLVLLFPCVGIGLAVWALRLLVRRLRWGAVVLEADQLPLSPGGTLRGQLAFRRPPPTGTRLAILARCVATVPGGDSTRDETRGQARVELPGDPIRHPDGWWRVPVRIVLPSNPGVSPTTLPDDDGPTVRWVLGLERGPTRSDPDMVFPLPVFGGAPEAGGEGQSAGAASDPQAQAEAFGRSKVRRETAADGTIVYARAGAPSNTGLLVALGLLAAFDAVGVVMLLSGAIVIGLLWCLFSTLVLGAVLVSIGQRSTLLIDRETMRVEKRFGPVTRRQEIAVDSITSITTGTWATVNNRALYQIAITSSAGTVKAFGGLPDAVAAEALAARLREDVGIRK